MSARRKQSHHPRQDAGNKTKGRKRLGMDFPEVAGKVLSHLTFDPSAENQLFILVFEDETELCLSINPGFSITADYSGWQTGNQQVLKRWPAITSEAY